MYTKTFRISLVCLYVLITLGSGKVFADHVPGHINLGVVANNNDFELKNRDLVIRDSKNRVVARIDAQSGGDFRIIDPKGKTITLIEKNGSNLWLGGNGKDGDLVLLPRGKTGQNLSNASVHINGDDGTQILGGAGTDGQLVLRNKQGKQRILINAKKAQIILGQEGVDGDIFVRDAKGKPMVTLDGSKGKVQANQIISKHSSSGGSGGIDTASIFVQSKNPAIGLHDNTGGNKKGWMIQAGSTGGLSFHKGDQNGVSSRALVLKPDGGVCIGACK